MVERILTKFLNHTWNKHGFQPRFFFVYEVSDCTRQYNSIQSFERNAKNKHTWLYDHFLQQYDKETITENNTQIQHQNYPDLEEAGNQSSGDVSMTGIDDGDNGLEEETLAYKNSDHGTLTSNFLLGLGELINTTAEAICYVSEKQMKY